MRARQGGSVEYVGGGLKENRAGEWQVGPAGSLPRPIAMAPVCTWRANISGFIAKNRLICR